MFSSKERIKFTKTTKVKKLSQLITSKPTTASNKPSEDNMEDK